MNRKIHAFIVEDDEGIIKPLIKKLRSLGHEFTIAKNQEEARSYLKDQVFDYVLLDLKLPVDGEDMDPDSNVGFNILQQLREKHDKEHCPVIVMTAYGSVEKAVEAMKKGANDFAQKPFKSGELEKKIIEILNANIGKPQSAPENSLEDSKYASADSFRLNGICRKRKYLVIINDKEAWIPLQPFELLCRLAFKLKKDETGWLHTGDMDISGNVHQAIGRLKKSLSEHIKDANSTLENDGHGSYRLSVAPDNVSIDLDSIKTYHSRLANLLA